MADRQSWSVKGTAILTELVKMMDVSAAESQLLGSLHDGAKAQTTAFTDAFYKRLLGHAATAEYLDGVSVERLTGMLGMWFSDLFRGNYDEAYAQQRLKIGEIHVRIGLPVRYPLAMLDVIMPFGEQVASTSSDPAKAMTAFRKVLALDVALFNQAYEDNQLSHLADLVGGERLARLLLAGQ